MEGFGLDDLPFEVLLNLTKYLSWKEFKNFRLGCKIFLEVCNHNFSTKNLIRNMYCGEIELIEAEQPTSFKDLLKKRLAPAPHQLFLVLDDLPVVVRQMGASRIFVLDVHLEQHVPLLRDFLEQSTSCLVQKVEGVAPWGDFQFVCMTWGSLFAGFSFYRFSGISSVYLGPIVQGSVLGNMHSAWNDVTGSFYLRQTEIFAENLRDNAFGDSFINFHSKRSEEGSVFYALSGGSWSCSCVLIDGENEVESVIDVIIASQGLFVLYCIGVLLDVFAL